MLYLQEINIYDDMKVFWGFIFVLLLLLLLMFVGNDSFVLYCVVIPLVSSIIASAIYFVVWWNKPEWCNNDWDYMSDKKRKAYLKQKEEQRMRILEKLHIKSKSSHS